MASKRTRQKSSSEKAERTEHVALRRQLFLSTFQKEAAIRRRSAAPSIAGFAGSNPARGMDVCLLWMLCVVLLRDFAADWSLLHGSSNECVGLPSVIRYNNNPLYLQWVGIRGQTKREIKKEGTFEKKSCLSLCLVKRGVMDTKRHGDYKFHEFLTSSTAVSE